MSTKNLKDGSHLIFDITVGALAIAVVGLVFARSLFGVETTDEIHGIAGGLNVLRGRTPFIDSWDFHPGQSLLALPFGFFIAATGSTQGIVLFSRLLYDLVVIGSAIAASLMTSNEKDAWGGVRRLLLLVTCVAYVPFSIPQLNYNSMVPLCSLLACAAMSRETFGERQRFLAGGIILGVACIGYPTFVVASAVLALVCWHSSHAHSKTSLVWFCVGGLLVAFAFFGFILFRGKGSWDLIPRAIQSMLASPHQASRGTINIRYLYDVFYVPVREWTRHNALVFSLCALQPLVSLWRKEPHSAWMQPCLFVVTCAAAALICHGDERPDYYSLDVFTACISWIAFDSRLPKRPYIPYLLAVFAFTITYGFTTDNRTCLYATVTALPLISFIAISSAFDYIRQEEKSKVAYCFGCWRWAFPLALAAVLAIPSVGFSYRYVYRDNPIPTLDAHVESGVYRGLYTTSQRARQVVGIEAIMSSSIIGADETLCVVTREPMLYAMCASRTCSPYTWDPQFLVRGNTSAKPLLDYFEATGETPDVIAATDSAPEDFFENDTYEIWQFIHAGYHQILDEDVDGIRLVLWRRNEDEQ